MRQPNGLPHHLQEEGERHGDEAAAAGHDAVGQAKAALEVVTKDDERGLEGQGAAAAEEDPVREITNFQRPSGKKKKSTSSWLRYAEVRKPSPRLSCRTWSRDPGLTSHRCYTDSLTSRSLCPGQSEDYPHFTDGTLNLQENEV